MQVQIRKGPSLNIFNWIPDFHEGNPHAGFGAEVVIGQGKAKKRLLQFKNSFQSL